MKRCMEFGIVVLILCILLLQISATSAQANEIWVAPSEPETTYGNWGVTNNGDAHFSFGVPDNMSSFTSAKIVIISSKHLNFKYVVNITVASSGQSYKNGAESELNNQDNAAAKELNEIDVSSIIPSTLVPGQDHISIYFSPHPGDLPYIRVVGLRFAYAGPSGAQGPTGATGSQGPQGPQGPIGLTGATGAQGPIGATGAAGAQGPQGPAGQNASGGIQLVSGTYPPSSACTPSNEPGCQWIWVPYGSPSASGSCSCPAGYVFYQAVTDCSADNGNCEAVSFSVHPTDSFVDSGTANPTQGLPTGAQITMNVGANLSFNDANGYFTCYCAQAYLQQ
jgi:hypothetical protein